MQKMCREWDKGISSGNLSRGDRTALREKLMDKYRVNSVTQFYRVINREKEIPEQVTCPVCGGEGDVFLAWDMESQRSFLVRKETWMLLPETKEEARRRGSAICRDCSNACPECDGEGKITVTKRR